MLRDSTATATISGLGAYFAALPSFVKDSGWTDSTSWSKRVSDLRAHLMAGYTRVKGNTDYPVGLWNHADHVGSVCDTLPPPKSGNAINQRKVVFGPAGDGCLPIKPSLSMANAPSASPSGVVGITKTTVQLGVNPINYGDLRDTGMIQKITSALAAPCPDTPTGTYTHCSETYETISPIAYVKPQNSELGGGDLAFKVVNSKYMNNAQRDGMIATAANALFNSIDPKSRNCIVKSWQQGCGNGDKKVKSKRLLQGSGLGPSANCQHGKQSICTGPDNIMIIIADQAGNVVADMVCFCPRRFPKPAFFSHII